MKDKIFYIYRHIRLDNNEVFYIGKGKKYQNRGYFKSYEGEFRRAYSKGGRTHYWKNIVKKHGYRVEIILDDLTYSEANEKEREFIKLYGRKDLNLGLLVNFTDGGDGEFAISEERRRKIVESRSIKVIQFTLNGEFIKEWSSAAEASRELNICSGNISHSCCVLKASAGNYLWVHTDNSDKIEEKVNYIASITIWNSRSIIQLKDNVEVGLYNSASEASTITKIGRSNIKNCLRGYSKSAGGFTWKYKNTELART